MRSGHIKVRERFVNAGRTVPSLVNLCVQTAIDNVKYLGDVGGTDEELLDRILSHCTMEQLAHIEASTENRDLSPITDKLWKNFYKVHFGAEHTNNVVEKMKRNRVSYRWKSLYEVKMKQREEEEKKSIEKLRERYKKEDARKQSRQIQLCKKVPPSSCKRSFYGGGPGINLSNTKSNIMKKAKLDFVNSREMKNLAAMKKNSVQKRPGACTIKRPGMVSGKGSASSSTVPKPLGWRFRSLVSPN